MRIILLLSLLHLGYTQDCQSELPPLPEYFHANLQYNIKNDLRYYRKNKATNKMMEEHKAGMSFLIEESVDNRLRTASVIFVSEQIHNGVPTTIWDKIIWNDALTGVKNFVNHVIVGHPLGEEFCLTDSTMMDGNLDWIFGIEPDCELGHDECGLPSVANMLHTAGCWNKTGVATIRGVETIEYTSSDLYVESLNATLGIKYYWSDLSKWVSSSGSGKSVPITALLRGSGPNGESIDLEIDYQSFFEVEQGFSSFYPPEKMYCEGRDLTETIQHKFPTNFDFGSELVLEHKFAEEHTHRIISSRHEWYDFSFNISRIDYKPIGELQDPFAGGDGLVSEIMDFNVGLNFIIDQTYGNCTIKKLGRDPFLPGDVTVDENGHIIMGNPITYFHLDHKFAYNGEYYDRGIMMDTFVSTYKVSEDMNYTTVVYTAAKRYLNGETGAGEDAVPLKIIQYPSNQYNNKHVWTVYNIYQFKASYDGFQDFDISACYEETEKMRLAVRFPLSNEIDLEVGIQEFIKVTNLLVAYHGHVAPIRIQKIETIVLEGKNSFELIFTVVGPPPFDIGANELPIDYTTPNKDIKESLTSSVNSGTFVLLLLGVDNSVKNITAVPNSLHEVDSQGGGGGGGGTNVDYQQGYTSGAMAGLAFGMIFLGMAVSGGVYFVLFRNNVRSGLPVMRGIDNPLAGLANLGK
ncbi:uncharacterized protein LOC111714296 [Eurytemora carolleeae]|uniref:uncharacterized protein LOC111714296 n=1 Tax=Eurytemora carolleeae TaxID=1294199 RepID=UPI000C760708|nr:uncharacterized protein LOC111714296 [Eurytemora carolleeae]|eukprot:XP_023345136.1 uncharacterized protein LOC111714296 [Eurytemora affinis]